MSEAMSQTFKFVNIAATGAMVDVTDELAPEAAGAAQTDLGNKELGDKKQK